MRARRPLFAAGLLAALLGGPAACGAPAAPDDPPLPPAPTAEWWLGDWEVDAAALNRVQSFQVLSPEAQTLARGLIAGSRWRLAFDSRRVHLPDGRLVPFRVDRSDEARATLVLTTGEPLELAREARGLRLTAYDLPLRRAP